MGEWGACFGARHAVHSGECMGIAPTGRKVVIRYAREAARRMFAAADRPDAVFVANDHMAFATMDVLRFELGLRIPDDVSVVGFDDVPPAAWPAYDLTNENAIAATMATQAELPDRALLGEDVIWCGSPEEGMLGSHRILSTATHAGDGTYGHASGGKLRYCTIADCHARDNRIDDEWLIRDQGAIVRQLGWEPARRRQRIDTR